MTDEPRFRAVETEGRDAKGRFAPGNPGRPRGARHRATLAAEAILDGEADALTRKAVELAMQGDTVALRLCLERIAPPRKDRPVTVELPALDGAGGITAAMATVLEAVAAGSLTPSEGQAMAALIEAHRRAVETAELEARITALEDRT
ncbi:DUF5681 domain-containing protein [uncultured Rhodospira sp.]|uniref:DUF5681 domain-containing protein n=1 Tax=uncultured Rhodospira sp. TaxID=1936189 RepID=UPI002618A15E|nr:DUF5681 domain-containing protein [uncultured Rhodospira sp.]